MRCWIRRLVPQVRRAVVPLAKECLLRGVVLWDVLEQLAD